MRKLTHIAHIHEHAKRFGCKLYYGKIWEISNLYVAFTRYIDVFKQIYYLQIQERKEMKLVLRKVHPQQNICKARIWFIYCRINKIYICYKKLKRGKEGYIIRLNPNHSKTYRVRY